MNLEDIKKLTVADLKKELKARNLPVSGNKTELLQRLSEHISANDEHQILDQTGRVDESLLEGVQEDEVLGLSTGVANVNTNASAPPKKVPLKKETSNPAPKSADVISNASAPVQGDGNDTSTTEKDIEAKKIRLKPSVSSDSEPAGKAVAKVSLAVADPDQAKIERAKKFNLPLSDVDKKNLRAERFGIAAKSKGGAASVSGSKPAIDASLLEKRAQRFGLPATKSANASSTVDNEKLKQRGERFGLQNKTQGPNGVGSGVDKEKLLKRQARFGSGAASGSDGDAVSDAKKARAERFGTGTK